MTTIPGTNIELCEVRDDTGRLIELSAGGRRYLWVAEDGRHYEGGVTMFEAAFGRKLVRSVRTERHGAWVEEYRLDHQGRPVHIDGVDIARDERQRVVACGEWRYEYRDDALVAIASERGDRRIAADVQGRAVSVRERGRARRYQYDGDGVRLDAAGVPEGWATDELGRLWTVTGADRRIERTYLWDGFACIGRIDGPPGEPLAAVFSLDPTCTPVRVITAAGVTKIPRDAFGEALLEHAHVPGLFGGAQHRGQVLYAVRSLDPRTGSFTAPDPWDGGVDDPRRADGYRGTLAVERGAYTVAMHDPVGRIDPTGEASVGLYISTFTWSWQNNLVGWLAMDFFLNLWGSLFGAIGNREMLSRFGDFEHLTSSKHIGATAVRRDGIWSIRDATGENTNAWAFQHMVWASSEHLNELSDVQVVQPGGAFEPALYGSMLHIGSEGRDPLLLRGSAGIGFVPGNDDVGNARGWTRTASADDDRTSRAVPMWDGCVVPRFPRSALHLDAAVDRVRGTMNATLSELTPTGAFGFGTHEERTLVVVSATGIGVLAGDLVYFGNGTGVISRVLSTEERDGSTHVRLEDDASGVIVAGSRLREVQAQTEEDVPRGAEPAHLNLVASSSAAGGGGDDYDVGDFLRFSAGGNVLGAGRVERFEARITIDSALPATLAGPHTVRTMTATPGGSGTLTADPRQIIIPAGAPPLGNAIAVMVGGTPVPVFLEVQDATDPTLFTVDRELYTGASQDGTAVTWERLANGLELAANAPAPDGTTLTYAPTEVRRAPDAGFVSFESAAGRTLRRVTARAYDALVLNAPVPGTADPVHVERFTAVPGGSDEAVASTQLEVALALQPGQELFAAGADTSRSALHLVGGNRTTIAAGVPMVMPTGVTPTFAGNRMTVVFGAGQARDGQVFAGMPVVLAPPGGGALEMNAVRTVSLTLPLDRATGLTGTGLRVVALEDGSPRYDGVRVDDFTVTALPNLAGVGRLQMPQFWAGEIVRVQYTVGGTNTLRFFRVGGVDGTTLTVEGDRAIDAGATGITVTRMNPADPDHGGPWAGIEGSIVPGTPNDQLSVRVWRPADLTATRPIAIIDGATAHPAQVVAGPVTLELEFVAAPTAGAYAVTRLEPDFNAVVASVRREGDAYIISDFPPGTGVVGDTVTPGNVVYAVAHGPSTPAIEAVLSPGTVRAPEIERHEVDRRQSLVDHELTHTLQSARWGPMLLCFLPYQLLLIDRAIEAIPGVVTEFSQYVGGTLERRGSYYTLEIASGSPVTFQRNHGVEITLEHVRFHARLAEAEDGKFPLVADAFSELAAALPNETPTPVQVRRQMAPGAGAQFGVASARFLGSTLHLGTHGGVLNATVGWTYGGLLTLLARGLYAAGRARRSGSTYPATVIEGGAAIRLTSDAGVAALQAEERLAIEESYTLIRAIGEREEDGAVLRLVGALPSQWSEVRVSTYSTRNPDSRFDWHRYFPASVPDATRPAQVRVEKIGGRPTLEFRDEVWLKNGTYTWIAKVLAVEDEGASLLIDLNKPVAASITEHAFQLAKGDRGSPGFEHETAGETALSGVKNIPGFLGEDLMNLVGAGWMRWVFNPWGEGLTRLHGRVPDDSFWWKFLRVFTHIASTSMNTYGWTIASPALGWLIWDRELTGSGPHMSYTEQEAATRSGDMYSPGGRLFGPIDRDGDNPSMFVGDVVRYVYYAGNRFDSTLQRARQDRAGALFAANTRSAPGVAADPGRALPDLLYQKNRADPYAVGDPTPAEMNFRPAGPGWEPVSDRLERASAMYVAFSRPSEGGTHLVTVNQGIPGRAEGVEANDRYQPLFFNINVRDVAVTLAGQPVANDATVRLVRGQRARLRVTPDDGRTHVATLTRPASGPLLRIDTAGRVVARDGTGTEPAQVDRVHDADALQTHLRRRIAIPVREFSIEVVAEPPVLATLPEDATDLFAGLAANPNPGGTVFVIVPASVTSALAVDPTSLGGLTAPAMTAVTPPAALADFVGDGAVYQVVFAAGDTPGAPVPLIFRATVQGAEGNIELSVTITVDPA